MTGVLPSAEARPRFVATMFGRIAPRYDLMNTLMTAGLDRRWRVAAVRAADPPPHGLALDVGAGTGRLALALAERMPDGRVIASDFCAPMLEQGRAVLSTRPAARRLVFHQADAMALPYRDATFDCVTSAFTVRNVASLERAFGEMARVVRPAGRVVCLELTLPRVPVFATLFRAYFRGLVPWLGRLVAGDATAYTYLPASVAAFPPPEAVARAMAAAGLADVRWRPLGLGTVALYVGTRPAEWPVSVVSRFTMEARRHGGSV